MKMNARSFPLNLSFIEAAAARFNQQHSPLTNEHNVGALCAAESFFRYLKTNNEEELETAIFLVSLRFGGRGMI